MYKNMDYAETEQLFLSTPIKHLSCLKYSSKEVFPEILHFGKMFLFLYDKINFYSCTRSKMKALKLSKTICKRQYKYVIYGNMPISMYLSHKSLCDNFFKLTL